MRIVIGRRLSFDCFSSIIDVFCIVGRILLWATWILWFTYVYLNGNWRSRQQANYKSLFFMQAWLLQFPTNDFNIHFNSHSVSYLISATSTFLHHRMGQSCSKDTVRKGRPASLNTIPQNNSDIPDLNEISEQEKNYRSGITVWRLYQKEMFPRWLNVCF